MASKLEATDRIFVYMYNCTCSTYGFEASLMMGFEALSMTELNMRWIITPNTAPHKVQPVKYTTLVTVRVLLERKEWILPNAQQST